MIKMDYWDIDRDIMQKHLFDLYMKNPFGQIVLIN